MKSESLKALFHLNAQIDRGCSIREDNKLKWLLLVASVNEIGNRQ